MASGQSLEDDVEELVRLAADALSHLNDIDTATSESLAALQKIVNATGGGGGGGRAGDPRLTDGAGPVAVLSQLGSTMARLAVAATALQIASSRLLESFVASIAKYTEAFDPGRTYVATVHVQNLQAAIGRLLIPALEAAVRLVRGVNEALTGLSPTAARMIAAVTIAGAAFAGAAMAATLVAVALSYATFGISTVVSALVSLGVGTVAFAGIMDKTGRVMTAVVALFQAFAPLTELVAEGVAALVEALVPVVTEFAAALADLLALFAEYPWLLGQVAAVAGLLATQIGMTLKMLTLFMQAFVGLAELFGLVTPGRLPPGNRPETQAAQAATFMSGEQLAQRAYTGAYSLGGSAPDLGGKLDAIAGKIDAGNGITGAILDVITGFVRRAGEAAGVGGGAAAAGVAAGQAAAAGRPPMAAGPGGPNPGLDFFDFLGGVDDVTGLPRGTAGRLWRDLWGP